MASRPRCGKRGSAGKDVGPTASRKPLGDLSALQNTTHPTTRKYQKTCIVEETSAEVKITRPRTKTATTTVKKRSKIPQVILEVGSDFEEPSSDSSPRAPIWFSDVPQKHRDTMESMLRNTGISVPQKERDLIIKDCCNVLVEHTDEFLEWMAAHERMSSLTTRLCQTGVGSPISSHPLPSLPAAVNLYSDEIFENLMSREARFGIVPDYMEKVQRDITHNMRSILVDWLVEVGEEYKLSNQTLFLAVNYIDRLLGIRSVNRNKLQLLGITSMLVAAKYEEIYPPTIDEFVYISDNTYSRKDVVTMESVLLTALQFNLSAPTAWEFSSSFCSSAGISERPKFLANFLAELFMMFSCSLKYRPSMVAAAAVFLALYTLHLPPWPPGIHAMAGNDRDMFRQCAEDLHAMHKRVISEGRSLKAIREKFQDSKWLRVSLIPSRPLDWN